MAKTSKKAQKKVHKVMDEFKHGDLKSGGSGKKVTNRKQAVAIALSEAREKGYKVPAAPKKSAKKAVPKRTSTKKAASKKAAKKASAKKAKASNK